MNKYSFTLTALMAVATPTFASGLALPAASDNTKVSVANPYAPTCRPAVGKRLFHSAEVERQIMRVKQLLTNPKLAWMFENCFPNTIDTTVHYRIRDGKPDTFVYTGDIHAMWLRDSGAQVWPYVALAANDAELKNMLEGVIRRQIKCILLDPYANAFNDGPTGGEWMSDNTKMIPDVHERKWEIDSLCYPIRLAYEYWKVTGDASIFDDEWIVAMTKILETFTTQELHFGKKEIDTKLGTRANLFVSPFFQLSLGAPATENSGEVLVGTLGWTGNFRFTFEVDNAGYLRVLSGINPYFSRYRLAKGESFRTPEFIFTLSRNGNGEASRNLHDWARRYQVKDGMGDRMTLLNNWESTYFDFDEDKLITLIGEAKEFGVDMFLLDDGWFGNKYPRHSDTQGLGDWKETANKLPNGIGRLTDEAKKQGVKFGLWIEPEMVNPKSELYEKHKDWVITLPNREEYYFRNQLVLDLSNPKVQDYVFNIVDELKTKYPDIAFFKWDCNSPITNIYSVYEKNNQSHLYIDYVRGLYKVLDRIAEKYPNLPMMLCAGGGGRTDYEGLKYFTEMWVSDDTDPVERIFIQWGFSQVFPAKVQCAHVTTWNKSASAKFRVNVAMMGKLGFDLNLHDLSAKDLAYCKQAVKNYNRLKPVILDGDQYRLVSPYDCDHAATMYVGKDKRQAVLFAFDIFPRYGRKFEKPLHNVVLNGLDPNATYEVREIDREDCTVGEAKSYSGDYLMTVGLPLLSYNRLHSKVVELTQK